jgi:hypothetical protein
MVVRGRDAQPGVHAYARQASDQAVCMSECLHENDNTSRYFSNSLVPVLATLSGPGQGYFTLRMRPGWVPSSSSLR